nr:class I SAM-dependent methyltransferase [Mycobacterium sp. E3198]
MSRRYRYRDRDRMLKELGPELSKEVRWIASDVRPPSSELGAIFADTPNIHKLLHYLPVYESALRGHRSEPIRMLEVGVARGGSLQMWRRYLHPESTIVGIDIDVTTQKFDNPSKRVHVRLGSQTDTAFLQRVIDEFGPFDVILDDGSHMNSHIITTFRYLFPRGLAPGGVYIAEDLCANYWTPYRDSRMSFADFTKWLIDAMHAHYQTPLKSELNFRAGDSHRASELRVPLATTLIEKVEFYDSIAAIHRAHGPREVPISVYQ